MLKIGDKVEHFVYGIGEIISVDKTTQTVTVAFEEEHEIVIHDVVDQQKYFEDNTRIENTRFINVAESNLRSIGLKGKNLGSYINFCHSCKKLISSNTHPYCPECDWLKCDCGGCKCNYRGRHK